MSIESLEKTIYGICISNRLDDKEKISDILHAIEVFAVEQERDKRISKTLKSQINTFTKYMDNIDKGKVSSAAYFSPHLYIYGKEKIAYFGEAGMLFTFEDSCQFVKEVPEKYILHVDDNKELVESFNKIFPFIQRYKSKERNFKLSLSYAEILAAKKFSPSSEKLFIPFKMEIKNEFDSEDIIHRWLNAYTLQIAFKIIGEDSFDFYMTDDYLDAMFAEGYNDRVGNYLLFTTFSNYGNAVAEYELETKTRREKLEKIEKEQKEIEEGIRLKGKSRKIKLTRIVGKNMPSDEDLPF